MLVVSIYKNFLNTKQKIKAQQNIYLQQIQAHNAINIIIFSELFSKF